MKNKEAINRLKNNAELAMAAYGYCDLMTTDVNQAFIVLKDKESKEIIQ